MRTAVFLFISLKFLNFPILIHKLYKNELKTILVRCLKYEFCGKRYLPSYSKNTHMAYKIQNYLLALATGRINERKKGIKNLSAFLFLLFVSSFFELHVCLMQLFLLHEKWVCYSLKTNFLKGETLTIDF